MQPASESSSTTGIVGCATGGACTVGTSDDVTSAQTDDGDSTLGSATDSRDDVWNDTGGDECTVSRECGAEFCVAPFDPKLGVFGRDDFECVEACVEALDEFRWCADTTACCDPEAMCTDRGYCEIPDAGGSTSGGDSSTDAGSSESGSGSSTSQ